jgi:putative mRNA 3-end processing factor
MVHAVDRVYERCGIALPNVKALGPEGPAKGEVVVAPPHLLRSPSIARIRGRRTAVLTGWAVDGGRVRYRGVDASFPLSDHADFPGLVAYARASGASRVFTVHGYAEELARALRREGLRAEALEEQRQLELL